MSDTALKDMPGVTVADHEAQKLPVLIAENVSRISHAQPLMEPKNVMPGFIQPALTGPTARVAQFVADAPIESSEAKVELPGSYKNFSIPGSELANKIYQHEIKGEGRMSNNVPEGPLEMKERYARETNHIYIDEKEEREYSRELHAELDVEESRNPITKLWKWLHDEDSESAQKIAA